MRLALIWVGRAGKKGPEQTLCQRYLARLAPFVKWEEKVVKPLGSNLRLAEIQKRESDRIRQHLEPGDVLVLADSRGKNLSSEGLAEQLEKWEARGVKRLIFCVGGAMGVDEEMRQRADFMLSLSKMTLPHALARVVLVEQLYRAWCIKTGHPYHHEG